MEAGSRGLDLRIVVRPLATGVPRAYERGSAAVGVDELVWSADGRSLAYAYAHRITILDLQTGRSRDLRPHRGAEYSGVRWSPDGTKLAFAATRKTAFLEFAGELAVVGADGRGRRRLYENPHAGQWAPTPVWVDDTTVAFGRHDDRVVLVSVRTGRMRALTRPPGGYADFAPLPSPGGSRIVLQRATSRGRRNDNLWVVNRDGSGLRRLTRTPATPVGIPQLGSTAHAWSPDGARILFSRWQDARYERGVWTMDADGSGKRLLCTLTRRHFVGSAVWLRA